MNTISKHVFKVAAKYSENIALSCSGREITYSELNHNALKLAALLTSKNIINKKETEGIVLALRPESHDSVMEELLGIVITKGIRNALSVSEAMGNPHVEDDFHRILVQYLKTGQIISGLKEGTSLHKSLNMTLFEITLPPPTDEADKSKGFKEFIGAMEQFYAGMQSISPDKKNEKEIYFTLEVALANESDEVVIYAGIPNKHLWIAHLSSCRADGKQPYLCGVHETDRLLGVIISARSRYVVHFERQGVCAFGKGKVEDS